MRYNRVCPDCQKKFEAPYGSNGHALCPECREAHRKARGRRFYEEKMLGPRGPCLHCGKTIERGRVIAKYHRKCFALAQIGTQRSPEARAKMSAAQQIRILRDGPPRPRGQKYIYGDIRMRSPRELLMAAALDAEREMWHYEAIKIPYLFREEPKTYVTDFWLPKRNLVIEVKKGRADRPELPTKRAAVLDAGYQFALVNWPPPYRMQDVLATAIMPSRTPAQKEKPRTEMTLGERLVSLRGERGMPQWRLVERSGLPQATISALENGKPSKKGRPSRLPKRRTTWIRLAGALNMTPHDLSTALGTSLPKGLS